MSQQQNPEAASYVERYLSTRSLSLARNSRDSYKDDILGFIEDISPQDPLQATSEDIGAWLNSHTRAPDDPDDPRPWSRTTAQRKLASIRGWYEWLVQMDLCPRDPTATIHVKSTRRTPPMRFSEKDLGDFFAAGRTAIMGTESITKRAALIQAYAICLMSYVFGLRIEECLSMKRVGLERANADWRVTATRKGGKLRSYVIPEDTEVRQALENALAVEREVEGLPSNYHAREAPLFINPRTAKRWTRRAILRVMQDWGARAGWDAVQLANWSPHSLRHSRAYHLVNAGRSINDVQDLLDHASLTTTSIYTQHDQRGGDKLLADEVRRPLPRPAHETSTRNSAL